MSDSGLPEVKDFATSFICLNDERPAWLCALDTDPTAVYYRFFYEFTKRYRPCVIFEIGTYRGESAAHLAAGNPQGLVITLDIDPQSQRRVNELMLPNLVSITCDSLEALSRLKSIPPIDVLFIDGEHTFERAHTEYTAYRPHVRNGGLIFFDDIQISPQMQRFWTQIVGPKESLENLHYTGFGVVRKDSSAVVSMRR